MAGTAHPARSDWTPPAGRFLLAVGIWLAWLAWIRPLTLPDEGRYAGVAWDMLRSGSHAVPLLDGMPYFHKPPLYYWLAELSFSVFGVHPWAARVPSWLAAWGAAAALYVFVRRHRDAAAASLAVLILTTMPFFYGGAQFANLDMLVAGLITLCVLAATETALRAANGQAWRWMSVAAAALAALAVLAKGLIGLVLPGAILLAWLAWERRWRGLAALVWPPALMVFLAVAAPWFVLMQLRFPGFYDYFFVYQHFQRFAAGGFNNAEPFWFYLPVLAGLSLPWSLWSGGILRRAFWAEGPARALRRLAAVWFVVVVAFFSLPHSKLIGYVLPALAPLAFLLAEVILAAWRAGTDSATPRLVRISAAVAASVCVIAVGVAATHARGSAAPLAKVVREQARPEDTFVSLHAYPFDLALYARALRPSWVVDDWLNPEVPVRDNWRKELYDAAKFDPATGQQVLVSAEQFNARLCAAPEGARFWVWGNHADGTVYASLQGLAPAVAGARHAMWRVDVDAALRQRVCAGTPTAG
ncbi:ArnT family glycosyltransferase [Achromobacter arsenitoxydans]|uniref:Dolichyl-phosphate-mannose-protein mannosyltransferase family protein 1 n=1 Tax=Achromobacter arsenitoxydans SY8 TaxID=477184 RepID=H0F7R2_9BURK|nr:glycosyltransferase family 39 protein [Achromobacter arsenitoxydans]EHK65631.1 dolichyl-phosphate-mannose-protein mannosyltransferase family protein 1 [Achromobacter arsenitoxydans SY8]